MKEKIVGIMLIIVVVLAYSYPSISNAASSKTQLNNEQKQIENKIAETKENLNEVGNNKSQALKEIENLTAQITTYESDLESLNSQISNLNKSIYEQTENLQKATEEYENQEKILKERLVVLYEEGLDDTTVYNAIKAISNADLLIVGGTSLAVYPAAGLIQYFNGNHLVLINKDNTPLDDQADLVIHDSIGKVLGEAV